MISKKYEKQNIQNKQLYIIRQLTKCFIYQDNSNNLTKWKKDIYYLLHDLHYLKPFKRFPTYNQLKKWSIKHFKNSLHYIVHYTIQNLPLDEYPPITTNYNNEEKIEELITEYYNWLITQLSNSSIGCISHKAIFEEIDLLILKYKKLEENIQIPNYTKLNQ